MNKIKHFFTNTIRDMGFIRGLISILILVVIFSILSYTSPIWGSWLRLVRNALQPFVVAYIVAYVLSPLVKLIDRKLNKRGLSILIVMIISVLAVLAFIFIALPNIFSEINTLLQLSVDSIGRIVASLQDSNFFGLGETLQGMNINLMDYINISEIARYAARIMTDSSAFLIGSLVSVVSASLNGIVILIITIYFLTNEEGVNTMLKKGAGLISPNLPMYLQRANVEVRSYINAFGIVMLSKLPQYMLLFFLIGHRSWFLLGVLNMIAVIIPYIGPVLVNLVSLLTAFSQGTVQTVGTIGIIGWSSFVDQYLITPKIYGQNINVNPLLQLFAVFVNATLFGIVGVVIAIPQVLIIRSVYNTYKELHATNEEHQTA
ncbi:AI-2E family transporter [Erysipelothrix sp. HDW6C]|uniref:AI-2E family transporter n=1 Tax=Erysipelothrix sp. HDW6C TaxID=2714930 RepID=UPI00140E2E82|nr:AI-2E family transporter [Erysipelothrix sp. HDW6C]QIK70647.1 AI-2E family transporter [Erysipelothrix sp. HDW6C]